MRKLIVIIGILIGSVLLAFLGMGLFLMLAPGTKLFGIKYVKATNENSATVTRTYDEIPTGDIIIETYGVPVTVVYTTDGTFEFNFTQKFNGFTKTNIDKPNITVGTDDQGNLLVKTNEFVPIVWGSNNSGYSLECKIPAAYAGHNLTFSASTSNVTINSNEFASGSIADLTILTKGSIKFGGSLSVSNLIISNVKKSISIPQGVLLQNVKISQKGAKSTTIKSAVTGDINFSSQGGSLTFVSCNNITVSTKGGKVVSRFDGTCVNGNAKISTKSGKVVLQKVHGDLDIKTKSGNVYIGNADKFENSGCDGKVNISTKRGNVYLYGIYSDTEKAVTINTTSGDVKVGDNSRLDSEKASGALASVKILNITTKQGYVSVESVTNATITTKTGNIEVGKFNKAKIKTSSGNVKVAAGTLAADLEIVATKISNVTGKDLTGPTTVSTKGKVNLQFSAVFGKIDVKGKDKAVKVVLPDSITVVDHYFWIESERISATIQIGSINESTKKYHSIETIPDGGDSKLIKITSEKGKITVVNAKYA